MNLLYLFAALIIVFAVWYIYWLIKDAMTPKPKKTGIYCEYAKLWKQIEECSHPVELCFLQEACFDWEADHRGENECAEMFKEIMLEIQKKEAKLTRRRVGVVV